MRTLARGALALLACATIVSCSDTPISPVNQPMPATPARSIVAVAPQIVISQIYGGGGNSGATYRNDFIELFNPGAQPVSVNGWSVQYASAAGNTWQVTTLSGTIPPGGYYLVQQAAGTGGTTNLPTPDATGSIPMSATAGKVALVQQTTAVSGTCPATFVDLVPFGAATSCVGLTNTATLSNTTAALRGDFGCAYTGSPAADFTTGAPTPRNSSSPTHPCQGPGEPDSVAVAPLSATINTGATQAFSASAFDANGQPTTTTFTWSSDNTNVATVDAAGVATGVGIGTATISATSSNGVTGTAALTVQAPPPPVASVVVSPSSATVDVDGTAQFTATAFDASNNPIPGTTFTWSSADNTIATVDANGIATGHLPGDVTITATADGVSGDAALHVNTVVLPEVRFSEIHYDNFGTDAKEAIEIEGPADTNLLGWSIVLYNGNGGVVYNTTDLNAIIPNTCNGRGVVFVTYPQDGIQNGSPDGFALVSPTGVVEFLSYEGTFTATGGPASGLLSKDIGASQTSAPVGTSLRRDAGNHWASHSANFGACADDPAPPATPTIEFSGRTAGDPALPVGFEDQLFGTQRDTLGAAVPTTITWSSETPTIASIDQDGVFRALSAGVAVLRATATDGTTATYSLQTRVAVASATASYVGNAEFGEPSDNDASDDFIVRHPQYTSSYNQNKGTPNWVSYNLEATHFGPEDRCDCFTFDDLLPGTFTRYTTADYTGAGTFHGFGIDRGHLARSFDRTSASLDNARTYLFSNIIPQASDNNQGPWAIMENYLGDLARFQNKEVYIVAGPSGSAGTLKDEGIITLPTHTWKVALIMPRDQGLAQVDDVSDIEVIAVIMPNVAGIRNVDWNTYRTTVDAVEALTGYDLLALLPDQVEIAVESNTSAPVAATDGPYTSLEGSTVSLSGAASSDADGDNLTYAWDFGDGSTGTGTAVTHTYPQDGSYTVTLTVTDVLGLTNTTTTTATVNNVAPSIAAFAGATLLPGETYSASGSFTDPGADSWSATVNYGDGSGTSALPLSGQTFSLQHAYTAPGSFTVTVNVSDDDVTSNRTQTVVVWTLLQGIDNAIALVDQLLVDGKITQASANALKNELNAARKQVVRARPADAVPSLQNVLSQLNGLVQSGRLSAQDAEPLRSLVQRLIDSIT